MYVLNWLAQLVIFSREGIDLDISKGRFSPNLCLYVEFSYVCLVIMFLVIKSKKVEPREKGLTLLEVESHDLSFLLFYLHLNHIRNYFTLFTKSYLMHTM